MNRMTLERDFVQKIKKVLDACLNLKENEDAVKQAKALSRDLHNHLLEPPNITTSDILAYTLGYDAARNYEVPDPDLYRKETMCDNCGLRLAHQNCPFDKDSRYCRYVFAHYPNKQEEA